MVLRQKYKIDDLKITPYYEVSTLTGHPVSYLVYYFVFILRLFF